MTIKLEKFLSPFKYLTNQYQKQWQVQAEQHGFTLVVVYHSIVARDGIRRDDFSAESGVSVDVFTRHMEFLSRHFEIVSPHEASTSTPGKLRCAVTFDDGFLDNLTVAAPVLKRLGMTAGFYICSDYVGSERWFWWEIIAELLRKTRKERFDVLSVFPEQVALGRLASSYSLTGMACQEIVHQALVEWLRPGPQKQIDQVIPLLADALEIMLPSAPRRVPLMDWSHIRELRRQGFEIGGHTANHVNVAHLDESTLQKEMWDAHQTLEARSEGSVPSFAYPYGGPANLSEAATNMAAKLGYRTAFTTAKGIADNRQSNLLAPRITLNPRWFFGCAYNVSEAQRLSRS